MRVEKRRNKASSPSTHKIFPLNGGLKTRSYVDWYTSLYVVVC